MYEAITNCRWLLVPTHSNKVFVGLFSDTEGEGWHHKRNTTMIPIVILATNLWTKHHHQTVLWRYQAKRLLHRLNMVYNHINQRQRSMYPTWWEADVTSGYTIGMTFCLRISFLTNPMVNWSIFAKSPSIQINGVKQQVFF